MFVVPKLICLKYQTMSNLALSMTKWASSPRKESTTLTKLYPADELWQVVYNPTRLDGDREVENTVRKNWQFRAASTTSAWLWHEEVGYISVSLKYYLSITAGKLLSEIEFQVVNSLSSEEPLLMSTTEIAALTAEKKLAVHPLEFKDLTTEDVGKYFKQNQSLIYLGAVNEEVLVYQISSQCFILKNPFEPVLPMFKTLNIPADLDLSKMVWSLPNAEPWVFSGQLEVSLDDWNDSEDIPAVLALLQEIAVRTRYHQYFEISCVAESDSAKKVMPKMRLPGSNVVREVKVSFSIHPSNGLIFVGDMRDGNGMVDYVLKDYFLTKLATCVSLKEQLAYIKEVLVSKGAFISIPVRVS